ncbi:carboxypeptidase regulatory-like domain-containing protein [Gemmatimonas aurantiaca]|uniref:carboxypeptidase regulatory-like domain-containing protein n=1 Tax=Gemmatimonas aurantiaca TaxID=173480 RepID=UPI00301BFF78
MRLMLLVILCGLGLGPDHLAAQVASGNVQVRVVDAALAPVAAAEVILQGEKRQAFSARSDSTGQALIGGIPPGLWVITVRRVGLKSVTGSIRVAAGQNVYSVQIDEAALTLVGMRVVGDRVYSARLDDFERRRQAGLPSAVVTQEQIDRLGPVQLSRMLRGMSGLKIADSSGSTVAISSRGAVPFRPPGSATPFIMVPCVMRMAVDGVLMPGLSNIDQIVPKDVHGIEVYYGPARMPPELGGLRTDNWCGLIAIWTRDR